MRTEIPDYARIEAEAKLARSQARLLARSLIRNPRIEIDETKPELFWGPNNTDYELDEQTGVNVPFNKHTGEYELLNDGNEVTYLKKWIDVVKVHEKKWSSLTSAKQGKMFNLSKLYLSEHMCEALYSILGDPVDDVMRVPECLIEGMFLWVDGFISDRKFVVRNAYEDGVGAGVVKREVVDLTLSDEDDLMIKKKPKTR